MKIGAYRKDSDSGEEGFTIAGVLVFGTWQGILDALPNYYIDYRERLSSDPAVRWTDRVYPDGYWEPNLYQFYTRVYMKMYPALPVPFKLENGSRVDDTPAHKALREAIVNVREVVLIPLPKDGSSTIGRSPRFERSMTRKGLS